MTLNENNYMAKIAMSKSVLKEYHSSTYSRIVYLNDGDEFQICLFNPYSYTIGAEISINDDRDAGIIIVRPGERLWIERPLGKKRKYKFETYEVEDSEAVDRAIKNNGDVTVKFYKSRNDRPAYTLRSSSTYGDYNNVNAYNTLGIGNVINSNVSSYGATFANYTERSFGDSTDDTLANNITTYLSSFAVPATATIETGRITTGEVSNQTFSAVDIEFEKYEFAMERIKLLPMSRKPYTSEDLQKVYCTECGRKLNPKFKFCPYCGTKCIL